MAKKATLTVVTTAKPPKMMNGTGGKADYFAFARKSDVVLGIKPEGAAPGEKFGVPDTVYFSARLRSAPSHGMFEEEDSTKTVVMLKKPPPNLWDAWPGVTWVNKNNERASTTIGIFVKGSFAPSQPGKLQMLLDNVGEGKLTERMAEYLFEVAGADNVICTVGELKTWLDSIFDPRVAQIIEAVEKQKQVQEAFAESVGNFGMQAALLKKVYEAKHGAKGDDPDPDGEEPEDHEDNDD